MNLLRAAAVLWVMSPFLATACSSSPSASPGPAPGESSPPSSVSAVGLAGVPLERAVCPDPTKVVEGDLYNTASNYEPVSGSVVEYTFCRRDWYSDRPPNRHLDMTHPQLVADVTEALAAGDQTASPDMGCQDKGFASLLPILVETSDGIWFLKLPVAVCGTVLDDLRSQLEGLDRT